MSLSQGTGRTRYPPLFDAFDRIRIVNLASRTDRRAEMERELRRVGLSGDPRVAFFPAVTCSDSGQFPNRGAHGCFRSHQTLIEEAAQARHSLLILEDDCDFLTPEIATFRLPERWDILYGGYNEASDPENLHESDIIGSHFMGFSSRATRVAANYLNRYLEADFPPDARAAAEPGFNPAIRPPVDGAFVWMRRSHPELVTTFSMLSVQRPSRTDIGDQRWFDRLAGVRTVAGWARRVRNALARKRPK